MSAYVAGLLQRIRRRFHPLFHFRRVPLVRRGLAWVDRPWMTRISGVPHPVAVRLGRNLGTVLSRGVAEEREERDLLIGLARANDCRSFWDVGANYGLFTFALRSALAHLQIDAFEPDPDNLDLLRRTLRKHGSDCVRVHAAALSDGEGMAQFERDVLTGATGGLVPSAESSAAHDERRSPWLIDVATSTMDAESVKLGLPDIVKIDVEGAELQVLRGGQRTLRDGRPILLLECTRDQNEVRAVLEGAGYEIRDPLSPTTVVAGPGMPFVALAVDPRTHRMVESASVDSDSSS
jgi:FkbM family methyltransferase